MIKKKFTLTAISLLTAFCLCFNGIKAQLPNPALVGYWQNWVDANYMSLTSIDSRYNVVEVSFAVPQAGTSYQMEFIPANGVSQAAFISQIQTLKSQGRKVLISMGGGGVHVSLDNTSEKNSFISSMNSIIDTYGFDGVDIDFEGTSLTVTPGSTITSPVDVPVINIIDAIKQIMQHHRTVAGTKLLLTMAPETVFVQGGMSSYGGDDDHVRGAYLPVIHALRDSIDLLQVQLYNSGNVYGIDGGIYDQATPDFITAMGEAVIAGFTTQGGTFAGLPASKVAIGLPACGAAAPGGGYIATATAAAAMKYLIGAGPKPAGTLYTLQHAGGYPSLRGMMTWSVNWDAISTCGGANEYAINFQTIFSPPVTTTDNALVGYWQNWIDPNAPYIPLTSVDSRYNIIEVSFAVPQAGTSYQMVFDPLDGGVSQATFISQIQTLKSQGRKVLISMGGGGVHVSLDNTSEKNSFISSMNSIIDTYGFDGIDIDFEGTSLTVTPGSTITSPVDVPVINLIDAIKQIMQHHRTATGTKLYLTMAPETVFVQGAMSSYGGDGGIRGAYLPVIHALRDSIDILQVQLYNSGNVYGIDGGIYDQATPDFITAMGEAVIAGFNTAGGMFTGLPASKIAIGLPACGAAAPGGGYIAPATVAAAMKYLMGAGPKPGGALYTLQHAGGYPSLKGMMTWSVNWDVLSTCAGANEYAINFQTIFSSSNTNTWLGTINNAWENGGNWSKGVIPTSAMDVIVNSGNPVLNSNGFCRSIKFSSGAHLTVNTGFTLNITH